MEVRVFSTLETYSKNNPLYARRLSNVDSVETDYSLILRAMRTLYGNSCVVVFICD